MFQVPTNVRSQLIAAPGDTLAHVFPDTVARGLVLQTPANAGTVTILGVSGTTADAAGLVLAANTTLVLPWLIRNLNQLAYKMSNGADTLILLYTQ